VTKNAERILARKIALLVRGSILLSSPSNTPLIAALDRKRDVLFMMIY
jgi:hypothetical protein